MPNQGPSAARSRACAPRECRAGPGPSQASEARGPSPDGAPEPPHAPGQTIGGETRAAYNLRPTVRASIVVPIPIAIPVPIAIAATIPIPISSPSPSPSLRAPPACGVEKAQTDGRRYVQALHAAARSQKAEGWHGRRAAARAKGTGENANADTAMMLTMTHAHRPHTHRAGQGRGRFERPFSSRETLTLSCPPVPTLPHTL